MKRRTGKLDYIVHMVNVAAGRWGGEEAERLRPALERTAEAVRAVEAFKLDPSEEPAGPVGRG